MFLTVVLQYRNLSTFSYPQTSKDLKIPSNFLEITLITNNEFHYLFKFSVQKQNNLSLSEAHNDFKWEGKQCVSCISESWCLILNSEKQTVQKKA